MKKSTEIRDEIANIDRQLYGLSDSIAQQIEWDGLDPVYLKSKFQAIINTTNHLKDQFKSLNKR